jgi:hypothetical protein
MSCVKMRDEKGKVLKDGLGRPRFFSCFNKVTSNPLKIAARLREKKKKREAEAEALHTALLEEQMRMRAEGGF